MCHCCVQSESQRRLNTPKNKRVVRFLFQRAWQCALAPLLLSAASSAGDSDIPAWIQNTKVFSDIRLRYQYEDKIHTEERHRGRLRLRCGFETQASDNVQIGLRLASGSEDQVSTNQTLEGTFSSKPVWLDRAYVMVSLGHRMTLTGGKMKNPYSCTELVWDGDVTPEGLAISIGQPVDRGEIFLKIGTFPIAEYKSTSRDPILYGLQGGLSTTSIGKNVLASVSYYNFSNMEGQAIEVISPGNVKKTNTLMQSNSRHLFAYAYQLVDVNMEIAPFNVSAGQKSLPLVLYGNCVQNIADGVKENFAWLAGLKLGAAKSVGDWQISYDYRKIDADAVPATINDSDFHGGGTNGLGHKMTFQIMIWKKTTLGANYFVTEEVTGSETKHNILQIDLSSSM